MFPLSIKDRGLIREDSTGNVYGKLNSGYERVKIIWIKMVECTAIGGIVFSSMIGSLSLQCRINIRKNYIKIEMETERKRDREEKEIGNTFFWR